MSSTAQTPIKTNPDNIFTKSAERFLFATNKKTMIAPEEMCSNFTLAEDELAVFLQKGCDDIRKVEKTKEDINKDKHVIIQSGLEATDPRNLLR